MSGNDGFDAQAALQRDAETVRRLNQQDVSPAKAIEYTLWSLALLCVVGMIVVLPWVGSDKLIPGTTWLGYSLVLIGFFGVLAMLFRLATGATGDAAQRTVERTVGGKQR